MTSPTKKRKFLAEGKGYDYASARKYGLKPDKSGHWPSRVPQTGLILKGASHSTFSKTIVADKRLGYIMVKHRGRYYSVKKPKPLLHL